MKNKSLILIIGESTGLECLKNLINFRIFNMFLVVSVDPNYHYIVRKICNDNQINFKTSSQFKKNFDRIKFLKDDNYFLLSIFSNLIIKNCFLKKFNGRAYNLHPGLLPFYPGKNCVSGVLYNNEKVTGVSLHLIKEKIDRGEIIEIKKIKILKKDNLLSLMYKLRLSGIKIINSFLKKIYLEKKLHLKKNKISLRKKFPQKIPYDGLINSKIEHIELNNLIRASYFGPFKNTWGKLFFFYEKKKIYIVSILNHLKVPKKKFSKLSFIEKVNDNKFNLKIEKKIVQVLTK